MKVSIIIPVYNVEKYLERCLLSVLEQNISCSEYEIIIVNDGSTDNSGLIINKFVERYPNVISFYQENEGLSSARNLGIQKSKGDYLFFIDSDDFLIENSLKIILDTVIKDDLDCIAFEYQKIDENGNLLPVKKYYKENKIVSGEDFLYNNVIVSNVPSYILKKNILINNNLKFTERIYHEDEEFTPIFLSYSNRVKYLNIKVYNYCQRKGSITSKGDELKSKKKINDIITVITNLNCRKDQTDGKLKIGLSKKIEQLLISLFLRMKHEKMKYNEVKKIMIQLNMLDLYPLRIKHQNIKFKIVSFIFNQPMLCKLFYS